MNKLILFIILTIPYYAFAIDQWLCVDDGSMRNGTTLSICGVGTARTEGEAREKAFDQSISEFKTICSLSSDCRGHKINVDPKRSTCFQTEKHGFTVFTCHRLINYSIQ
jgi:hypothetical protein